MTCVDVLINLPSRQFDKSYTYLVPESFRNTICFGKRVLVHFGKTRVEGYVINKQECLEEGLKKVLKVLDDEPVFNQELLKIAQWMADQYMCPISVVLNAMIPRMLNKKITKSVIPIVDREAFDDLHVKVISVDEEEFFNKLWEDGEISLKESLKYLGRDRLELFEHEGIICVSGTYAGYRDSKAGYVYIKSDFDIEKDMPVLQVRAPRQAEAMHFIIKSGQTDRATFDKLFPSASVKSLLKKGYIQIVKKKNDQLTVRHVLNEEQDRALKLIESAIISETREEFLLYGVTGSGKTEVYLHAAEKVIKKGKNVIVLVPEIALTRHLIDIFSARIENIAVLHSSMPAGERYDEWKRIKNGEVNLVLGTRSAVFAPLPELGLIIIDEEQENTYKQEESPRYHACEVARKRAEFNSAIMILGSATPSLETFFRSAKGETTTLYIKSRVGEAKMPEVIIADMRTASKKGNRNIISGLLQEKLQLNLSRGEQSILFINRRGYSPMTICRECGIIASCPNCSVGMTYHRDINKNVCHYCNYQAAVPSICDKCGSSHIQMIGFGTQKVEEESRILFPDARIVRLDLDSSRKKGIQQSILRRMKQKEIDILIGTQMVAKGLDFPDVSLVGIVDADSMLNLPDFRAGERAFQLIVQAAGRAGRSDLSGEVVIQTYNPDNAIIKMASEQDYISFYCEEIKLRRLLNYPPFTSILRIVVAAELETVALEVSDMMSGYINDIIDAKEDEIIILGPAPCPIYRLRNRYRYQIMIKCENMLLLQSIGRYTLEKFHYKEARIEVDINPVMSL